MDNRNLWIEFASHPGVVQGGLRAASNLTRRQLFNILNIAFRPSGGFDISRRGSTTPLPVTDDLIEPGHYILSSTIPGEDVTPSDEQYYRRTLSLSDTGRDETFRHDVRQRDGRCVITGRVNHNAGVGLWRGFEAAHVFPLALSMIFSSCAFSNGITDSRGINSPNNGLLLRSDIHQMWDGYEFAINPDDDYRVYSFSANTTEYHGTVLNDVCRQPEDAHRVYDVLLRWHFEQAVLGNVRGAGELGFNFDFPPGTDMMGEIREGPFATERMEAELFGRLYGYHQSEAV
ncbi:hypothetical protein H112_00250 [Trichophyton rubrum D6]|uniref:Uncharacterized protein n=4 Tax=Trichophyton TaxID=5550 RepID=A0A178EW97_TRIRU|nr:uncharacterized protein TERG_08391 [Trichophyton rubrum CBS 118892]EZF27767.1 hypothetical protein H100_00252 [Trichophyton rubrum MR850]EZF46887.1 hypothetical protein H102_00250 [Trichophyton rubrum CBS 100081]EZF57535.1 hypothetical protein H103_00250 [Trichophyton rubrum CBS 288.86]EZF68137.1 hypothetical protein H104_00250 [Trichophyton rubrum CBS 289.86]EZF78796.1 hypothetical protein H105_00243 [Trichophyton soudanense CBS 452.61]EZF89355.1 hypothetical protein H110_00252 [Trichophy